MGGHSITATLFQNPNQDGILLTTNNSPIMTVAGVIE